jgi:hypothetical protein
MGESRRSCREAIMSLGRMTACPSMRMLYAYLFRSGEKVKR